MKAGCRLGLSAVCSSFDWRKRGRRESAGRRENNAVYGTPPWKMMYSTTQNLSCEIFIVTGFTLLNAEEHTVKVLYLDFFLRTGIFLYKTRAAH